MRRSLLTLAITLLPHIGAAQHITYDTTLAFDDVLFGLENAIIDHGLKIDSTSHVGDMLERTRADVGSDVVLFTHAQVFSFCSAALSRKVMEADPMNIAYCPYTIYVMERADTPGTTFIGYREYPDGAMQEVQTMLDEIVANALAE